MTATVISIDDLRARRATGQPLRDRAATIVPIRSGQQPSRVIDIAAMPPRPGIVGLKVRLPDNRVGKVAGVFEVNGCSFARIWFGFLTPTTAVDCRELEFIGDGPGSAA